MNFQDSLQLKASGKLSAVRLNLSKDNQFIQSYQGLISNNNIGLLLHQLDSIITLSQDTITYSPLLNQLYNSLDQVNIECLQFNSALSQYLDQQGITNNSILPDIIVNDNEKILNTIQINHRLKGNSIYSSDEIDNLTSIALQCPREGGISVYRARTKMYDIDRTIKYSADALCNTIAERRRGLGSPLMYNYSMIPDRNENQLKFICNVVKQDKLLIKIFDLQGRDILCTEINGDKNGWILPFNKPKNNFYLITVIDNSNCQSNFKLIW